jgi:hypothetical protein
VERSSRASDSRVTGIARIIGWMGFKRIAMRSLASLVKTRIARFLMRISPFLIRNGRLIRMLGLGRELSSGGPAELNVRG